VIYCKISALVNAAMALTPAVFIFVKQRRTPAGRALIMINIAAFMIFTPLSAQGHNSMI